MGKKKEEKQIKKVLFTATVDSHILHFHIPYLKLFKDEGYEVHVATNGDETIPYCDKKHKISFERSPFKLNNLKAIKQLKKVIDSEHFDIIHCHTPMGSVVTRLAAIKARKNGTRVIYTAHGFHFYKGAPKLNWILFYPIEKILSRVTDTLITINEEDYNLAKKKFHSKQIELVHGVGVDPAKFNFEMSEEEKDNLRKEIGINKDDFVMIYPAELSKRKNQGMLLRCVAELVKGNKNIKLLLPGLDSMNGMYQQMAKDLNIEENVKFLGYRTDIPKLLKISNLAVSAARQEGLPVNIMEAMAYGLPVVATNCRGNRDLVENGVNGYVVEIDDDMAMIEFILKAKKIKQVTLKEEHKTSNIYDKMNHIYFRKMKIMHLLASNIFSGAENVVCQIMNLFKDEVDMVYCSPYGKIRDALTERKMEYFSLEALSNSQIRKAIKEINPDIIHAHDKSASVKAALFSPKNVKVISQIHGTFNEFSKITIKSIIYYLASFRFSKIIFVSQETFDMFRFKKALKRKSIVLSNIIDIDEIKRKSEMDESEYDSDIVFLGRLTYPKNPERFINLMKEITKKEKFKDIKISIVGDGELRPVVEKVIKEQKLDNNIKIYGFLSNPHKILKSSKVFVMTSRTEGTPMAALEAMALGVPIVSTPTDGMRKLVIDGKTGFLSDKDDILVERIYQVLENEKISEQFSKASMEVSLINNDKNMYKKSLEEVYNLN